ncbi:hypothetical protein QFC22_004861 [Naganishia vaughanmartiniae]|uniref:Uncharacterized protein n=1 Tax=Naganishia vaughanmartiniae TaxID=1424756 RepID=A0ACC2WZ22_9TREE|nr:hypothetical protein QFC22_004861 [Naganishia vaughanmartiniae]
MSDALLVNPREYDVDLHDVYAAFMWNHSFASYFTTFNDFLAFGWGAIVVTDKKTGRGHVAIRSAGPDGHAAAGNGSSGQGALGGTVQQFARMIKVRFGESLPKLPNQLPIDPFESKPRLIRIINDLTTFKRLQATIPSAELNAKRKKLRAGDPWEVQAMWSSRNHTFLALEVVWWERGNGVVLEAGVTAMRCRNIDALDSWPPIPDENYRRAHYVVSDWLDKAKNKHESPYAYMAALEKVLNATISTLSSPESDSQPNTLVIVAIGEASRLHDLHNVHIPANVMIIDLPHFERCLFRMSTQSHGPSGSNSPNSPAGSALGENGNNGGGRPAGLRHYRSKSFNHLQSQPQRDPAQLLSLRGMLSQLSIPVPHQIPISNSGNTAFYVLLLFHMLIDKECSPPAVLTQQPTQQSAVQGMPQPPMYPHMVYPHFQIYPAMYSSPLAQHAPNGTGPSSRQHRNSTMSARQPTPATTAHPATSGGGFKRSTTMYWDDPQPLGPVSQQLTPHAAHHPASQPPMERKKSGGDLPHSMSRMTLNGAGGAYQRERRESLLARPTEHARRHADAEK